MQKWRSLRDEYLAESLRLAGCGDASEELCPSCTTNKPAFRCRMCHGGLLYCRECMVETHEHNPLHVIDVRDWILAC